MKSPEQGPNTESGFNRELLDLADQIEKGTKWDRIPMEEAREVLNGLVSKYHITVSEEPSVGEENKDKHNAIINVMEHIEDGVKSGHIPVDEAISVFRELNDKYPVEEDEQS